MSVNFNSAAMGAFRNVNLGSADSIANLDDAGGVKKNGKSVVRPLTAEDIDALDPICNTIVTGNVEDDPDEK